jgi:hypothetical protein
LLLKFIFQVQLIQWIQQNVRKNLLLLKNYCWIFFWAIYSKLEIEVSSLFNWNYCRAEGDAEQAVNQIEYNASFPISSVPCNDVLSGNFVDNYTFVLNNGKKIITTFNVSSDNAIYRKGRKIKWIIKNMQILVCSHSLAFYFLFTLW